MHKTAAVAMRLIKPMHREVALCCCMKCTCGIDLRD